MKHLRLLGMESEREALLKAMQDMECVEISSIDGSEEALKSGFAKPDDKALMSAQEASRAYRTALASLDRFAPEKKGMFRKRQGVSRAAFFSAESEENARTAAETINKDTRRLGEIESERTKNEALRATLAPWLTVDAPLGGADGALAVFFGTAGLNVTDDALKALADSLGGLLTWQQASSDRSLRYLLVMCHGSVKERALSALRDLGFSTVSFRGMTGTAKENDKALAENLAALEKERQEIEQRIAGLGGKREALLEASDRAAIALRREEAKSRLVGTDKVFLLEGWLPADRCAALEKALEPFTCAIETREPTEDEYPQVPVQLKNNKLTRPLNMVTEMYSLPAYDGIDPNPLMFFWYIFFFGFMFADVAYGIIIYLACTIIQKKVRPKNTLGYMMSLGRWLGGSITFCGIFAGGFFGNSITTFSETFLGITQDQFPAWLSTFCDGIVVNPVEDPLKVLIIAICVGCVHLVFGQCIRIYMGFRDHEPLEGILDVVPWWIVFAGIAVLVFCDTPLVLILGALSLILTQGRHKEGGIIKKIMGGITSLYDITSWLSDVLSYARLMALMLAGSVIGMVFNTIAALPGNIIVFFVVFLIGHTFNIGVNLIGTYVHDARLQYLEFFGKFYKEGGIPFKPLKYNTKYVDIIEEEK